MAFERAIVRSGDRCCVRSRRGWKMPESLPEFAALPIEGVFDGETTVVDARSSSSQIRCGHVNLAPREPAGLPRRGSRRVARGTWVDDDREQFSKTPVTPGARDLAPPAVRIDRRLPRPPWAERQLGRALELPLKPLPDYPGSAIGWDDHLVSASAFDLELPGGELSRAKVHLDATAIRSLARRFRDRSLFSLRPTAEAIHGSRRPPNHAF